ncbi:MAG TPA: Fe-S cluster assembly protein SufD [Oscillatoriales cyanobacterium M59_W2019_021]|nr:Fe-S cluster assembly protein SufD [Oscillatoriales cyanobacterium M4454_W2019_049]HIK49720.1 Fe-S cluster assembly protein SufD [Oscillatoriales cyanobacterium M59_W2019_021]
MITLAPNRNASYLAELLKLRSPVNPLLQEIRDRAESEVRELAIPTTRDEDWRFTDLSSLLEVGFQNPGSVTVTEAEIAPFMLPETDRTHLVFVDGVYAPDLSNLEGLPDGVYAGNLEGLSEEKCDRLPDYFDGQLEFCEVFTALNSASFSDVAIVWVAKGTIVETPIQVLLISTLGDTPTLSQPRCLVVAEANSGITFVEQYASTTPGCPDGKTGHPYFTNAVTEICIEANAEVRHVRTQRDAAEAFHIGKSAVTQHRDSRYTCHAITLGAKLSRHNLEVFQSGEGTQTTLNGLTLISGEQVADTHSTVALEFPNGTVDQLHKCILDGKSHGVFDGRICVPKAAQLTNASQLNRNLLLSPKARVNTKPQLEIVADNVKCAHGATVSQLEEDEVFYLQSRGLDRQSSENLLIDAFAAEVIQELPIASLKNILSQCVSCRSLFGHR